MRVIRVGRLSLGLMAAALVACAVGTDFEPSTLTRPVGVGRQALVSLDGGATLDAGAASDAGAPEQACCSTSAGPGCSDAVVLACVCEGDDFCCSTEYDAVCVTQAQSRCGLSCETRPPVSDCCEQSDVPGCTRPEVEACICDIDPFCCAFRFDESCVNLARARCAGSCGGSEAAP
jgi:hypothetical protein